MTEEWFNVWFPIQTLSIGCPRPAGYCVHLGSKYYEKDCDGDGILDPVCQDEAGHFGILSSASGCTSSWPTGICIGGYA